eukprot:TRINITY_DN34627_c0_g1_i1.p1 TRINITY_DN34627_c0_g1~~TRINITY_DN34627_c0_g1_i1.p1  ORF type:complete len:175 (+),score=19.86 TRINITY_DN34627_c0_g1_i1:181-705(+)
MVTVVSLPSTSTKNTSTSSCEVASQSPSPTHIGFVLGGMSGGGPSVGNIVSNRTYVVIKGNSINISTVVVTSATHAITVNHVNASYGLGVGGVTEVCVDGMGDEVCSAPAMGVCSGTSYARGDVTIGMYVEAGNSTWVGNSSLITSLSNHFQATITDRVVSSCLLYTSPSPRDS